MTEQEALVMSTHWVNGEQGLFGYLPLSAANYLVSTGKYEFWQVSTWGYVVHLYSKFQEQIVDEEKNLIIIK